MDTRALTGREDSKITTVLWLVRNQGGRQEEGLGRSRGGRLARFKMRHGAPF